MAHFFFIQILNQHLIIIYKKGFAIRHFKMRTGKLLRFSHMAR
ncbi:MAG: hypothetical protein ACYCZ0_01585 [Minisyncoccota bacterium]